jgi:hypothetical protein
MANVLMVRGKVKPDSVAQAESAAKSMFSAIQAARPTGVHYASAVLPDGVTFLALLQVEDGIDNPLPQLPAFREFQEGLKGWLAEAPTVEQLTVVGSYALFA